jgi:hypothetical protein
MGKGKPPKQHQFAKGKSGNPGGKKKETLNLKTILMTIAESPIEITENGRKVKVQMAEKLILRHFQEALRGRPQSIVDLLDRLDRYSSSQPEHAEELPEEDRTILDRALAPSRRNAPDQEDVPEPDDPGEDQHGPHDTKLSGRRPELSDGEGQVDDV